MGKKNNKGRSSQANGITAAAPSVQQESNEDKELLNLAKKLVQDGDNELKSLIKKLAEKADEEHKLELEMEKDEFKKKLEEDNKDELEKLSKLKKEIEGLEEEKRSIEEERINLEMEKKNIEIDRKKILEKAEKEAKQRLEQVYSEEKQKFENDQKELEEKLSEIGKKERQLADEKVANDDAIAQERKKLERAQKEFDEEKEDVRHAFEKRESKLKDREAEYDKANPEKLAELESQINSLKASIERWKEEYEKIRSEKTELELRKAKSEGYTIDQLQQEKDRLSNELDALHEKFGSYDDLTLKEMSIALEEKPGLLEKITQLQSEIANKEHELSRKENVQLEYEQLKERLSLLRTLNDHLKTELTNTRRMLESSSGDICPALTGIDVNANSEEERGKEDERKEKISQTETLSSIVDHVLKFAASQSIPLYYSKEDMKAFIAGLAASHLAILQGMSGTGKTSLPDVFAKAILGEVSIVPVESSWRDRNELLGYYNDFSKKYTAKEFTCNLYRANTKNAYKRVPYFIVLDEMNLSRIEYYFADFLSILEMKDSNDWKILLNDTDMRQLPNEITPEVKDALEKDDSDRGRELKEIVSKLYPDGRGLDSEANQNAQAGEKIKLLQYLEEKEFKNRLGTSSLVTGPQLLIGGKQIRVPENVWFIGTANKDESTFEITDKVYDRAQVMSFYDRAKGAKFQKAVPAKFIPYSRIQNLFQKARADYPFDGASFPAVKEIDTYLKEHFSISFGNRILKQMDKFVPTYLAASAETKLSDTEKEKYINEALDYQITNKVLRKLEYIDLTEEEISELKSIFEKYNMKMALRFLKTKKER